MDVNLMASHADDVLRAFGYPASAVVEIDAACNEYRIPTTGETIVLLPLTGQDSSLYAMLWDAFIPNPQEALRKSLTLKRILENRIVAKLGPHSECDFREAFAKGELGDMKTCDDVCAANASPNATITFNGILRMALGELTNFGPDENKAGAREVIVKALAADLIDRAETIPSLEALAVRSTK